MLATSGLPYPRLTQFSSDCNPTGSCLTPAPSIFGQGGTWKSYEETMPSNCYPQNFGEYAVRHNPAPYYTTLQGCGTNDVPYTQLSTDLADNALPAFSVITPNVIDDMHDGTSARLFNHYSLLGTAKQLLRLPQLGQAADFPTIIHAFNL